MSTPVNMGAVAAMGKQFTTNVFQSIQNQALKSGKRAQIKANRARPAAPAYPSSHTPPAMPAPSNAMGGQMTQGRANRQARAAGRNTPPTAQTSRTPYAPGVPAAPIPSHRAGPPVITGASQAPGSGKHRAGGTPNVAPVAAMPANAVASGRAARQARSQTGQALALVRGKQQQPASMNARVMPFNPIQMVAPGTGSRRAGNPAVTGVNSSAGTGRHRAGAAPATAPVAASSPVVQSLQSRGQQVNTINQMQSGPKHAAPTQKMTGTVAPSSIIPSAPSALPKTTSGTTVGRSVHQQMQARINTPKVNTIQNPPSTGANHPYPTHVPPANSSTQILPTLSAAQSTPNTPNTFTVGSRNIKGNGIAAMGSQLEAGLSARPIGLPPKKRRV